MPKKLLLKISGPDKPGITAKLTAIIAGHKSKVMDIGQSVIHGLLSLSLLAEVEQEEDLLRDLLFEANDLGINLEYKVLEGKSKQVRYHHNFILSAVQPSGIPSLYIAEITRYCADKKYNIFDIDNRSAGDVLTALDLEFICPDNYDFFELKKHLLEISGKHKVDMAIMKNDVFRFNKRLIIFDMDSTLVQVEVIEELARLNGCFEKVKSITDRAMEGELDYTQSLHERVKLLKGISREQMEKLLPQIPLSDGVERMIKVVKSLGFKVGIVSGGFSFFANHFKNKLNLDYAFSNNLEFDQNNQLTGKVTGTIVDANQKATILEMLAGQESISLEQVVAIGDGANDLNMLSRAGMGIAFHAKEIVRKQADHHMSFGGMDSILTFLGIPEDYSNQASFR